jgi:hypothetical protein
MLPRHHSIQNKKAPAGRKAEGALAANRTRYERVALEMV